MQDQQKPGGANGRVEPPVGLLPTGTRIRFTRTITDAVTGDHPAYLYAREGDEGVITGHGTREGYEVLWDYWSSPFGASRDEFEPIEPNASLTRGEAVALKR